MLSLTRKTDYALIALTFLARHPSRVCTAREIAEHHGLPLPLLMNVLKSLSHGDLVSSTRGAKGGYRLGDSPARISLAAIILAVEGPVRFVQCAEHTEDKDLACDVMNQCPIRGPVIAIQRRLESFLADITLSQLIEEPRAPQALNLAITPSPRTGGGSGKHQAAS